MIILIEQMLLKMKSNFSMLDYGFLKLYGALAGLLIGAYFPTVIKEYQYLIVGIFLILAIRYSYLLFIKKAIEKRAK